jgi:hypothetical protein
VNDANLVLAQYGNIREINIHGDTVKKQQRSMKMEREDQLDWDRKSALSPKKNLKDRARGKGKLQCIYRIIPNHNAHLHTIPGLFVNRHQSFFPTTCSIFIVSDNCFLLVTCQCLYGRRKHQKIIRLQATSYIQPTAS